MNCNKFYVIIYPQNITLVCFLSICIAVSGIARNEILLCLYEIFINLPF